MSECAPGSLKGAMFLYHGFSACPDAYNTIAAQLQSECWHVYQMSTIGHGFKYCGDAYDGSTSNAPCTAGRYNETTLPETRAPYIEFVERMNGIIEDEVSRISECEDNDELEVAVGGLSFGAPLAAGSVVMSGEDSVFTKLVLMSPFFGVAYKGLDDLLYKCLANTMAYSECLPTFFEQLGYDISDSQSAQLSAMVEEAVSYYVDESVLDNSFATFNFLLRSLISWSVEAP